MRRLKRLSTLSAKEFKLLARAVFWLPIVAAMLRLNGFQSTLTFFCSANQFSEGRTLSQEERDSIRQAVQMIDIAARHGPFNSRCLQKSLVLLRFLQAWNIPAKLLIGTRCEMERFSAHAWVKCAGEVVNDSNDVESNYTIFDPTKLQSK